MATSESVLLTRVQAAKFLALKPQTLAAWAVDGRYNLRFVKVGRSARYRISDLEEWLRSREVGAAAAGK